MPHVFLSYCHADPDEGLALRLRSHLERDGFSVFVDTKILVGQKWRDEIVAHLGEADHFIVLLSAASVASDMVRQEIADAYLSSRRGKLRIYPIRLSWPYELPYDLGAYLNPIQHLHWNDGDAWGTTCEQVTKALRSPRRQVQQTELAQDGAVSETASAFDGGAPPLPAADPRLDTGGVQIDSSFYVVRAEDATVKSLVRVPGNTVMITGPRQVGKTSLLARAKAASEQAGIEVVYIDFQLIDLSHLHAMHDLALCLAHWLARGRRTKVMPSDVWNERLGARASLSAFIEDAVLADGRPLTLCFDEVDRVFAHPYRDDFFAMLRAWHNLRAMNPAWKPLGLIAALSTEPALFIRDLNQSPFNVGQTFRLGNFSHDDVMWLNERHGRPLSSTREVAALLGLLGGHPYLVQLALYLLATRSVSSLAALIATADHDTGPFVDHFRRHVFGLANNRKLSSALKRVVRGQGCADEETFQRLKAGGLIDGQSRESAHIRCELYRRYFSRHL